MTDEAFIKWFEQRWGKKPNAWQMKHLPRPGEVGLSAKVQPDVQYYRPYRGKRTPLTGTREERIAKIRELDAADCEHGRDEAERREIVNLD